MKFHIPLRFVDYVLVVSLIPFFILRAIHWLFDRHWMNDIKASLAVDRFASEFSEYLAEIEIRPGRFIRVLHIPPTTKTTSPIRIAFIHGACARMQQFMHQIQFCIGEGFEVLSYDALGCGGSQAPVGAEQYVSEEMYLDMLSFVEKFKPACIVGHSMGGAMVAKLAASANPTIKAAVSICPPSFVSKRSQTSVFHLPISVLWLVRPLLGLKARDLLFGPKASSDLRRMEKEASARNAVHMFKAFYMGIDRSFVLLSGSKTQVPLLLLAADKDKICPPEGVETNVDESGLVELETLKECGHQCMQEDPDQVNRHIVGFLKKNLKL